MVIISILLRYQGINEYKLILLHALDAELSPVMIKKLIYQTADYLRIAHMFPFLDTIKDIYDYFYSPFLLLMFKYYSVALLIQAIVFKLQG